SNTFTFDTAVPLIAVVNPVSQANDRETPTTLNGLSGTASDPVPGNIAQVQLRVRNETGPTYWDPALHTLSIPAAGAETAWFNALTADQYNHWTSTSNNISYAGLDGSTFTVMARSLNFSGTYSVPYASNTFVYDSLAPQTSVTLPANSTFTNTLATLTGTLADLPAANPGGVPVVQLRLKRLRDNAFWTGATGAGVWTAPNVVATMGAVQGVAV